LKQSLAQLASELGSGITDLRVRGVGTYTAYRLTATKLGSGGGSITSAPPGIDCGAACSANFSVGATVALTGTPEPGGIVHWVGCDTSTETTCTIAMQHDSAVSATFATSCTAQQETCIAACNERCDTLGKNL